MTEIRPFRYKCDGEGCSRTEGDIAVFLWYYIPEDEHFCPDCFEKLAHEKKMQNCRYSDRPAIKNQERPTKETLPDYLK